MQILCADDVLELHHQLTDLDKRRLCIPYTEFREQIDSAFEIHLPEAEMGIWAAAWNLMLRIGAEQPFLDGNKRTAWRSVVLLLKKNGYFLSLCNRERVQPFPRILQFLDPGCNHPALRSRFIRSLKNRALRLHHPVPGISLGPHSRGVCRPRCRPQTPVWVQIADSYKAEL